MDTEPLPANGGQAPGRYPEEWVEQATLRDGLSVLIRPIRPDDADDLQAGFRRLSPESIYLRFLGTMNELSDNMAQQLATLDYHSRMAFVATVPIAGKEILIGVARYGLVGAAEPGMAECAIVVGDEYQGRGLGQRMLDQLIRYARAHGVTGLLATIHSTNTRIKRFIERSGFEADRKMTEPGVWEVRLKIA
jgi:acetyltransferase